jgi:hypothetical protein
MSWGETLFLKKVIDGRKRFVASDATIGVAYDGATSYKFTPKLDGVIRVSATVFNENYDYESKGVIKLKNLTDGTEQESEEIILGHRDTEVHYTNFFVKKGKTYYVGYERLTAGVGFKMIRAEYKAQIVDNNYFSIGGDE